MLIRIKGMVQDSRVPINIGGQDDMGQTVPFSVSVGAHIDVRKPVNNVDGNSIAIESNDTLQAALDLEGAVVNIVHVVFQLNGRVDGVTLPSIGILVHDGNNGTKLGIYDRTTSANGDVRNLVVVDANDVNYALSQFNKSHVSATDATVCPAIQEGASRGMMTGG